MNELRVFAQDRDGRPVQHSDIFGYKGEHSIGEVLDSRGQATFEYDGEPAAIRVRVEYQGIVEERTLAAGEKSVEIKLADVDLGSSFMDLLKQNIPALLGVALLAVALILGFVFAEANPLQIFLIRSLFALGAAGVGSTLPGVLNINVGLGTKFAITAGGALAILVLLYIVNPPNLEGKEGTIPVSTLSNTATNATGTSGNVAENSTNALANNAL